MRSYAKVVTLLVVFGAALARGDEATTAAGQPDAVKEEEAKEESKGDETTKKSTEKRGLFRVTGVHGEQQFAYTEPQPIPGFQLPVESRAVMGGGFGKPYPYGQPSYQQAFTVPPPQPPPAFPYSSPMLLIMMPPQPGNPYPTFLMVPANHLLPQYTAPNHILPYHQPRVQFVPQYVPVKSYQSVNYPAPAAHFKGDYPQKPVQYQYQEQPSGSSEEESATPPPSYQTPPPSYQSPPPSYSSASVHRQVEYKG